MHLLDLHVENFRSLEKVSLEGLGQLNVLIGPNNAGKSAIVGAVEYLSRVVRGETLDATTLLTARDPRRNIRIRLRFKLKDAERSELIARLVQQADVKEGMDPAKSLEASPFFRLIEYQFESIPNAPHVAHVIRTSILSDDGKWVTIQRPKDDYRSANPVMVFRQLAAILHGGSRLDAEWLDVTTKGGQEVNLTYNFGGNPPQLPLNLDNDPLLPLGLLKGYLNSAFFFTAFRHSQGTLPVQETQRLDPSGANLAGVIHTIQSNNRRQFLKIEEFVASALPHLGDLQTPINQQKTEVAYRMSLGDYLVGLLDMGGGVEQLLMIAAVLATTGEDSNLFLEEPESHLHPGAQRFILERISGTGRQIVLTTHSPVFVNTSHQRSLYQVSYRDERTTVTHVEDPDVLSDVLSGIGARNSDVLMSDAVVFVEGPSDRESLIAWGDRVSQDLAGVGVAVIPMGGSVQAIRAAPLQAEVLAGISQKAPLPHFFLLDKDERSDDEVDRVQDLLKDAVQFLGVREIENYLLVPRALLQAIRAKCAGGSTTPPPENEASLREIERVMAEAADSLFGVVLLQRIKSHLPPLIGGVLPRERLERLIPEAHSKALAAKIKRELDQHLGGYLEGLDIEGIVAAQQARLEEEWKGAARRLKIAPGEEILGQVFGHYKLRYNKPSDAERIARLMTADEIPEEIKGILAKAATLGRPRPPAAR